MAGLARSHFAKYDSDLMNLAKNIFVPSQTPLRVTVLVLEQCNTLSFAAAVDPMRAANRMAARALFDWRFATATTAPAQLTSGLSVPGAPIARSDPCDLLIVLASFGLEKLATPALCASLRRIAHSGSTIAGIDGGPWVMAEAGVLNDRRATTHWEDLDRFAARFPLVTPLQDRFHIDQDRLTCGGAAPAIDMMLHLIEQRCGAPLASRVAGAFIYDSQVDPNRAQLRRAHQSGHSPLTAKAHALMERTLDAPLPLPDLARQIGTSPRHLQTRFRAQLGCTAQAHYLALRLAEAQRLVTDTDLTILEIALATGFTSGASFARAYRAAHGRSARQQRAAPASSC